MSSGFDEMSLALFTTLAPAGAVAFILLALVRVVLGITSRRAATQAPANNADNAAGTASTPSPQAVAQRIDRLFAIPFALILVGFIASATHLGTPANALYVLTGVGRSPLSNEVLAAVVLMGLAGGYWMLAFSEKFPAWARTAWLLVTAGAGGVFLAMTSVAYSVPTVPTWNTAWTPVILIAQGVVCGSVIALAVLGTAGVRKTWLDTALVALGAAAFAVCVYATASFGAQVAGMANNELAALALVPNYLNFFVGFIILDVLGLATAAGTVFVQRKAAEGTTRARLATFARILACVMVLAAAFLLRVPFYALHMTIGF